MHILGKQYMKMPNEPLKFVICDVSAELILIICQDLFGVKFGLLVIYLSSYRNVILFVLIF